MLLPQLSLNGLAQLFHIYVIPIYLYGITLLISRVTKTKFEEMDVVWTKYLKRYLHIPLHSNNTMKYHMCGATKISSLLIDKSKNIRNNIIFLKEFGGLKLSSYDNSPIANDENLFEDIPPWF